MIVLILALVGCGSEPEQASPTAPVAPLTAQTRKPTVAPGGADSGAEQQPEQPLPPSAASSLTPLPTVSQVQAAVVDGRPDPFQALNNTSVSPGPFEQAVSADPSTRDGVSLRGVLAVGGLAQALVQTSAGSGAVCVGPGGLCPGDTGPDQLLPAGWAVVAIDLKSGCLTVSNAGQAQPPLCLI